MRLPLLIAIFFIVFGCTIQTAIAEIPKCPVVVGQHNVSEREANPKHCIAIPSNAPREFSEKDCCWTATAKSGVPDYLKGRVRLNENETIDIFAGGETEFLVPLASPFGNKLEFEVFLGENCYTDTKISDFFHISYSDLPNEYVVNAKDVNPMCPLCYNTFFFGGERKEDVFITESMNMSIQLDENYDIAKEQREGYYLQDSLNDAKKIAAKDKFIAKQSVKGDVNGHKTSANMVKPPGEYCPVRLQPFREPQTGFYLPLRVLHSATSKYFRPFFNTVTNTGVPCNHTIRFSNRYRLLIDEDSLH